jgi:DNA ligase D-like protein (predicted 3'-phosphoesterase)
MQGEKDLLKAYREKRHFEKTAEPAGKVPQRSGKKLLFVIQKHQATTLHYDLRLEVGGVLKSWAVPKGPSTDPKVKRLAVPTEDHPIEYASFEGAIPKGEYGAGTVEVWDKGSYRNLKFKDGREVPPETAIADGHITFWLEGKKLQGGFALTRTGQGGRARWILVKMADEKADPAHDPVIEKPDPVLTGRSLEEITDADH